MRRTVAEAYPTGGEMRSRRQTQGRGDCRRWMAMIATVMGFALSTVAAYTVPVGAAPTSSPAPATAIIIALGTEAPAGVLVNTTIAPLTTLVPGAPPPALVVTPRPMHPATSTPPPTSTANPYARIAIPGTPRPNTSSPPLPGTTVKSTPMRAAQVPGQFTRPPVVPALPVAPVVTPAPTAARVPTPTLVYSFPTPTIAASATLVTATIAATETAIASATATDIVGTNLLPTAAAAVSRDLTPRGTQTPFGPSDHPATLVSGREGIGVVVTLALLVIVLGGVGVAGGGWIMWRARRAALLRRTQEIDEIR